MGTGKKKVYVLKPRQKKYKINYIDSLNPAQYEVVKSTAARSIVIAGAGTGKTRTLVYRVVWLIENGVAPDRILLVTFTNKAAREMLSRVERLLGQRPKGLWGGTFHHIGNLLLRKYGTVLNSPINFSILDEEDSITLFRKCAVPVKEAIKEKMRAKRFPTARQLNKIYKTHVDCAQPLNKVLSDLFPAYLDEEAEINRVIDLYKKEKRKKILLDFGDLLEYWRKLLQHQKLGPTICKKFQYVLVDEYQDVNAVQANIIETIAKHQSNIMVVGDDAQSIYSFRGADVRNLLEFPNKFDDTEIYYLELNYRSTPEILNFSNESIKHNVHQFKKKLRTERQGGIKVAVCTVDDIDDQCAFVVDKVLDHRDMDIPLNEMAVLFRAGYHSNELQIALDESRIPYEVRGGFRFFEKRHIKDVLSFIRVISNSLDELAWTRCLKLIDGIGDKSAGKIYKVINTLPDPLHYIAKSDFFSHLKRLRVNKRGWNQFIQIIQAILKKKLQKPPEIIETFLKIFYKQYLQDHFPNYKDRILEINQLIAYSQTFPTLEAFIGHCVVDMKLEGESIMLGKRDTDEEKLILSTIHQAKGLEWRVVLLIMAAQGSFPISRVLGDDRQLEEERRLFYVACTRAKDYLYIIHPIFSRFYYGNEITQPSQFITEVSEDYYEEILVKQSQITEEQESQQKLGDVSPFISANVLLDTIPKPKEKKISNNAIYRRCKVCGKKDTSNKDKICDDCK